MKEQKATLWELFLTFLLSYLAGNFIWKIIFRGLY